MKGKIILLIILVALIMFAYFFLNMKWIPSIIFLIIVAFILFKLIPKRQGSSDDYCRYFDGIFTEIKWW